MIYSNSKKKKNNIFPPFFFYSVPLFPHLFHPSYLPSVLIQFFSPFLSLPPSHFATSIPHVLYCLSLLIAHSAFLSLSSFLILSLLSFLSVSLSLIFPLFHWHIRFSGGFFFLSFFSEFFFFSLCTPSLPSILSSNFAPLLPAFTPAYSSYTLPSFTLYHLSIRFYS
jgi:hypothetical protein